MSTGLYSMDKREFDITLDPKNIRPYGDTMNDGKVQISFTLPMKADELAMEAAKQYAIKMGVAEPSVVNMKDLGVGFSFFVVFGSCVHNLDTTVLKVVKVESSVMGMHDCDTYIKENIGRKIVILGASTGTDAHTVGIDAIMNMKGYAGHYGLERYDMIEAVNLGSSVPNEEFIKKALELNADALIVSQTVTQKDIHIQNLTNLIELLEAEGLRDRFVVCCGGPRISYELAKELGYDAGFGTGTFADDVSSFIAHEMVERKK